MIRAVMTEGLVERNNEGENHVVNVEGNYSISMKAVQSLYNEITGKTETLSQTLRDDHEIKFSDIKQLNTKICQLYEQYRIVSKNCSVTVFHIDDCKEQFSSFERFQMYDSSNSSPCENIQLEYNFLIVLPETKKAQPYKITINLHSRAALSKKASFEHGISRRIIRIIASKTGNYEIEYIDYTVARNFKVTVDKWYETVQKKQRSKIIEKFQNISEQIPSIFKITTAFAVLLIVFLHREELVTNTATPDMLFRASLLAFGSVYILGLLSEKLGTICEAAIDSYQVASGLQLNHGDKRTIKEFRKTNQRNVRNALITAGITIALNILSSYLYGFFGVTG